MEHEEACQGPPTPPSRMPPPAQLSWPCGGGPGDGRKEEPVEGTGGEGKQPGAQGGAGERVAFASHKVAVRGWADQGGACVAVQKSEGGGADHPMVASCSQVRLGTVELGQGGRKIKDTPRWLDVGRPMQAGD